MATRTLVTILVYGGADFVPACLDSAACLPGLGESVDVLVLDDCTPDAAWSDGIRAQCDRLGLGFYRSPCNLGIPRAMTLALRRGEHAGYDYTIICNSDVVFPANLVSGLSAVAASDPTIASVTAWSNHVSSFSLENDDPDQHYASQEQVDRISRLLEAHFGHRAVDIPVGVGFCMLVPTPMARRVGVFDPIFGRGYCEEVDWCLRARRMGLRNVLAPGVFVYHIGNATTKEIGVLDPSWASVPANEAIVDLRYPEYRDLLEDYDRRVLLENLRAEGARVLVLAGAREHGYIVEADSVLGPSRPGEAQFVVPPTDPSVRIVGRHAGFEGALDVEGGDLFATLERATGRPPSRVVVRDRGPLADALVTAARAAGVAVDDAYSYPRSVVG